MPVSALLLALVCGAAAAQSAESYSYTGHSAGVLVTPFHTSGSVTGNWTCAANNSRLDLDGDGTVETSECYINVGDYDFNATCTSGGARTSPIMDYAFNGDKPGRHGSYVYHLVQANNFSERQNGAVPPVGPASELTNGGDEFWIFRCSIDDPLCQSSSPELVNASPRPNNPDCPSGNPVTDPTCFRYSWQLKAVNEFPTLYNKLDIWVKLQDQGLQFYHTNINQTGQPAGTKEFLVKPAVVVMNRTTNPYAINEQWDGIDIPRPAGSGYENVLKWNADNRWCDGTYGYSISGGCPNGQLEARITDFVVERRIFTRQLPVVGAGSPASGSCTLGVDCSTGNVTVDAIGFLNYQADTDRQAVGQYGGLCLVEGVLDECPSGQTPLVPASCSNPLNTSSACKPVHGCNCCEPSNQGLCTNKFLVNKASFVFVDARKTVFFPRYDEEGTQILGWSWVKWGEWLDVVPPAHPGITRRTSTLHLAPTPAGNRWEFWQMTGAANEIGQSLPGDVDPGPFEVPACGVNPANGALASAPFPKSNQDLDGDGQPLTNAWMCPNKNVGTVNESTLEAKLEILRYGFFDPDSGVISGGDDDKDHLHTFDFVNPYMPNFYKGGAVTWASGVLDLKKCPSCPRYRVVFWGTRANHICSVVNKTVFKIPGTQIVWERFEIPGYE